MFEGKVKTSLFNHLSFLLAPVFGLGMTGFLICFMIQKTQWYFWLPLLCIMLFIIVKSGLLPKLINMMNRNEFMVSSEGLITKEGQFIPWSQVKEVYFFRHGGYPHLGIKLADNVTEISGKTPDEAFKNNRNWSYYKMPIVTMSDHLIPSQQELIKIFTDDYGLKMNVTEADFEPDLMEK